MAQHGHRDSPKAKNVWMITYSDLLTGLLAFFVLLIVKTEKEAESTFRFAERMKAVVYSELSAAKKDRGLDWLYVEHAGTKGVKLLIPSEIGNTSFFQSGDDAIEQNFHYILLRLAKVMNDLKLEQIPTDYATVYERLAEAGKTVIINVRIEGHSDIVPLGPSSRFKDNWDLSTARAYQVMGFFMDNTAIPEEYFSVSGYGPFKPRRGNVNDYAENRRVEIYIDFQMVELTGENGV